MYASPTVETAGPLAAYKTIQSVLQKMNGTNIGLTEISVLEPDEPLAKLFKSVKPAAGEAGLRYSKNVIQDRFIEDAYIYPVNAGKRHARSAR